MKETSVIRNGVIYEPHKVLSQKCQGFLWTESVVIWHCFFKTAASSTSHPVGMLVLYLAGRSESLGSQPNAKLNLRKTPLVLVYRSGDNTGL